MTVKRTPKRLLPTDPKERKKYPMGTGLLDYFPDALAYVSNISFFGNEQHNPGEPLHWARGKSMDHTDTIIRHYTERGTLDTDGKRHTGKLVWRGLAMLQEELEKDLGLDKPRGATDLDDGVTSAPYTISTTRTVLGSHELPRIAQPPKEYHGVLSPPKAPDETWRRGDQMDPIFFEPGARAL